MGIFAASLLIDSIYSVYLQIRGEIVRTVLYSSTVTSTLT